MTSTLTPSTITQSHHTLLRVPATTRLARTLATDPIAAHAAVMAMFSIEPAAATPRADHRILFATRHHTSGLELLIASATPPDRLPDHVDVVMAGVRALTLTAGDRYNFQIRAVPTLNSPATSGRGHRYTPRTPEAKLAWLGKTLTRHGMTVTDGGNITDEQLLAGNHRSGRRITMPAVTYRGQLTITDPVPAAAAVQEGIGRGRAYGAGLLLLLPTL